MRAVIVTLLLALCAATALTCSVMPPCEQFRTVKGSDGSLVLQCCHGEGENEYCSAYSSSYDSQLVRARCGMTKPAPQEPVEPTPTKPNPVQEAKRQQKEVEPIRSDCTCGEETSTSLEITEVYTAGAINVGFVTVKNGLVGPCGDGAMCPQCFNPTSLVCDGKGDYVLHIRDNAIANTLGYLQLLHASLTEESLQALKEYQQGAITAPPTGCGDAELAPGCVCKEDVPYCICDQKEFADGCKCDSRTGDVTCPYDCTVIKLRAGCTCDSVNGVVCEEGPAPCEVVPQGCECSLNDNGGEFIDCPPINPCAFVRPAPGCVCDPKTGDITCQQCAECAGQCVLEDTCRLAEAVSPKEAVKRVDSVEQVEESEKVAPSPCQLSCAKKFPRTCAFLAGVGCGYAYNNAQYNECLKGCVAPPECRVCASAIPGNAVCLASGEVCPKELTFSAIAVDLTKPIAIDDNELCLKTCQEALSKCRYTAAGACGFELDSEAFSICSERCTIKEPAPVCYVSGCNGEVCSLKPDVQTICLADTDFAEPLSLTKPECRRHCDVVSQRECLYDVKRDSCTWVGSELTTCLMDQCHILPPTPPPTCDSGVFDFQCPEKLCDVECVGRPNAICKVSSCGECRPRFYEGTTDVTAECDAEVPERKCAVSCDECSSVPGCGFCSSTITTADGQENFSRCQPTDALSVERCYATGGNFATADEITCPTDDSGQAPTRPIDTPTIDALVEEGVHNSDLASRFVVVISIFLRDAAASESAQKEIYKIHANLLDHLGNGVPGAADEQELCEIIAATVKKAGLVSAPSCGVVKVVTPELQKRATSTSYVATVQGDKYSASQSSTSTAAAPASALLLAAASLLGLLALC